jgi:hypothetical protein
MDAMVAAIGWLAMLSGDPELLLHDGVSQAAMLLWATVAVMNHCSEPVTLHADGVQQWRLQKACSG